MTLSTSDRTDIASQLCAEIKKQGFRIIRCDLGSGGTFNIYITNDSGVPLQFECVLNYDTRELTIKYHPFINGALPEREIVTIFPDTVVIDETDIIRISNTIITKYLEQ